MKLVELYDVIILTFGHLQSFYWHSRTQQHTLLQNSEIIFPDEKLVCLQHSVL
jgi:hypothetical protein